MRFTACHPFLVVEEATKNQEVEMGFVFTIDEIRGGKVPTLKDFEEVRRVVEAAQDEPHWLAYALYGSLGTNTHNRRSDADVLAVCTERNARIARAHREVLIALAAERNVRLDFRLCTVNEGRAGNHRFKSTHRMDMQALVARRLTKGVPHQWILCEKWRNPRTDVVTKAAHLLKCFAEEFARFHAVREEDGFDRWVSGCWTRGRRPLRMHVRVARLLGWWHYCRPFDARKDSVLSLMQSPPFVEVSAEMAAMEANNRAYDELMSKALRGRISTATYNAELERLI
ncbi:MAG: hypothetical protein P8J32_05275, partial [bacterium]|nr:hypothetical protein [bacterium]